MDIQSCTHKGRQADGTWCVAPGFHERHGVDTAAAFRPPADVVAACRGATTSAAVRAACPDYYTYLELAKVASAAGCPEALTTWRAYATPPLG